MNSTWKHRPLVSQDQNLLWELLYIALWDAPEEPRRPRSVLEHPAIQRLVENWGRPDDFGLMGIDPTNGEEIGAIWARLDGYDDVESYGCDYPSLGIAVLEPYHGKGVGSFLMRTFIESLKGRVAGLRLGVNPRNQIAMKLYKNCGFETYAIGKGDYPQMKLSFTKTTPR